MSDSTRKIVVHSGKFHADDVFATATLSILWKGKVEIIRSRDPEIIKESLDEGGIVVDNGREYDPKKMMFDHHQGGIPNRKNGVPYAAFGLIWKHFGEEICDFGNKSKGIADYIDEKIVQPIDACDTGYFDFASGRENLNSYTPDDIVGAFNTTWEEKYEDSYDYFIEAVGFTKRILEREIIRAKANFKAREKVEEAYQKAEDKRIIFLDRGYPWKEVLIEKLEPLFVIFPEINTNRFMIQGVNKNLEGYELRRSFPEDWRGKVDQELEEVTGVKGARFCHLGGFLCVSDDKEGAFDLAKRASL